MKLFLPFVLALLFFAGCGTLTPEQQELVRTPKLIFPSEARFTVSLSRDYSFTQVRKMNIDYTYTLPAGDYRFFGEDDFGRYFIHAEKGVLLSGNFGRPLKGGFFVPKEEEKRLIVWWQPASVGTAMAILGPLGAGVGSADPAHEALLIIHIPNDLSKRIRDEVSRTEKQG